MVVPGALTLMPYMPAVVRVRMTFAALPTLAPSEALHEYGPDAPPPGFALYVTLCPGSMAVGVTLHDTVGTGAAATVTVTHGLQLLS